LSDTARHPIITPVQTMVNAIARDMPLFLCIDGGGTKTVAVISDAQGAVLSRGEAGPSNL
jgi:hypothetical protein